MLQGERLQFLIRLGCYCLAALVLLAITAAVQRQRELSAVEQHCIAGLQPFAENGSGDSWDYLYPWQGYSVYLIENRRRNPELLRLLLLSEARRVHPESYMNSYSINFDLRENLMRSVLPKYNDDPQVHWAAGVCHMNACKFSEAQHELQKALELGLSFDNTGVSKEDVLIRIMLAAAMDGDPTETMHWVRDTQLGDDVELQAVYADMLCRLYMYDECIEYCESLLARIPADQYYRHAYSLWTCILRSSWWTGDTSNYKALFQRIESDEAVPAHDRERISKRHIGYYNRLDMNLGRMLLLEESNWQYNIYGNLTDHRIEYFQILAEGYGLLDNADCREALLNDLDFARQRLADGAYGMPNELSWEERERLQTQTGRTYGQLVRGELLRHDWAAAQQILDDNADDWYWPEPTPISAAEFLLGIVNGEDLAALTEKLRDCIIIAPFLFHSPEYMAACEAGNRDPQQLQKELVHELANPSEPEQNYWAGASNYRDWSNGTLDW